MKLEGEAPMEEAFNDLNLHFFENEKLEKESALWRDVEEPPSFSSFDDPELIGADHANVPN